jgi:hypothetical protein
MGLAPKPTYNDPSYTTRDSFSTTIISGASTNQKFVTYANSYLYSCTALLDTIGTSTYTAANGTVTAAGGTATTSSQSVAVYIVTNTSTTTTAALATATYGPYVPGGSVSPAQAGLANVFVLNTNTSSAGYGGVYVPAGSEVYVQVGTDATAKVAATIDYQIAPLAAFTQ